MRTDNIVKGGLGDDVLADMWAENHGDQYAVLACHNNNSVRPAHLHFYDNTGSLAWTGCGEYDIWLIAPGARGYLPDEAEIFTCFPIDFEWPTAEEVYDKLQEIEETLIAATYFIKEMEFANKSGNISGL